MEPQHRSLFATPPPPTPPLLSAHAARVLGLGTITFGLVGSALALPLALVSLASLSHWAGNLAVASSLVSLALFGVLALRRRDTPKPLGAAWVCAAAFTVIFVVYFAIPEPTQAVSCGGGLIPGLPR